MNEFENFAPETVELIRRSVDTSGRCTTTRHYVDIPRDAAFDDGGGASDG